MEELKNIELSVKTATEGIANMKAANEAAINEVKGQVAEVKTAIVTMDEAAKANQKALDELIAAKNAKKIEAANKKSFGDSFSETMAEAFESNQAEFKNFAKDRNAKLVLDLKAVGTMTLTDNLTGDGQATYNTRQGLVPSQKINFRDLISTVQSPTGLYVTYRETGGEGALAVQTEGSTKGQIDYDLTEVKVVSDYIAGFARFSKQMMTQLPFLQSSLQRMLLRDFYKKENAQFFSVVSGAATGSTTTSATVDAEQLVDWIANQLNANFNSSFVLVNYSQWARLLKTKPSDYSVPGGVIIDPNGNIRICGVPVIGASWVTDDKALIIDSDYLERVETESLRVEFSYEDSDNFQRNLVTARVECFEDINVMRTDALIYADFGNAS
jgi:HK97 family phage major capsid protein